MKIGKPSLHWAWYGVITLVAVLTYFYALDSQHIPKNGDEYPYEHITRLTAASGHLLPLQSELTGMRNTKPPLLTWQGIASTDWGQHWTLWNLRYPSVVYTLLTGFMAFLLGWKISGRLETGFVALLTFLAFYSTYRYGRPYLTNAPECSGYSCRSSPCCTGIRLASAHVYLCRFCSASELASDSCTSHLRWRCRFDLPPLALPARIS